MKNISIIIPYKPDGGQHDINFNFVYNKIKEEYPKSEIVIGEDTSKDKMFNRSNAVNNGVRESNNDILMLHDVDILIDPNNIKKCMKSLETYPMIFPYNHFWLLPKTLSHRIINGMEFTYDSLFNYNIEELVKEGTIGAAIQLVTREAFDEVEGFNEAFCGWGWEDVFFNFKIMRKYPLGKDIWAKWLEDAHVFHLWHKPATPNDDNAIVYDTLVREHVRRGG